MGFARVCFHAHFFAIPAGIFHNPHLDDPDTKAFYQVNSTHGRVNVLHALAGDVECRSRHDVGTRSSKVYRMIRQNSNQLPPGQVTVT